MSIAENVAARKAAEECIDLVTTYGRENCDSPEQCRKFFEVVRDMLRDMLTEIAPPEVKAAQETVRSKNAPMSPSEAKAFPQPELGLREPFYSRHFIGILPAAKPLALAVEGGVSP